jgi:hypothetical protein
MNLHGPIRAFDPDPEHSDLRPSTTVSRADYEGHSLSMLRIAAALSQRVDIRFVPAARRCLRRP